MRQNNFHISASATLTFEILTSKSLHQLLLTWVTYFPAKFEHSTVFRFRVNGGHATDGRTNRRKGCIAWCIIILHLWQQLLNWF